MNLDCPELIADYHKRINAQSKKSSNELPIESTTSTMNSNKRSARESIDQQPPAAPVPASAPQQQQESSDASKKRKGANEFGYGRGLEIEKILGATDVYGELMFLYVLIFERSFIDVNLFFVRIKWQSTDKPELVPARIANVKSPQQVIRFYEDRLTWANTDENTSINPDKQ